MSIRFNNYRLSIVAFDRKVSIRGLIPIPLSQSPIFQLPRKFRVGTEGRTHPRTFFLPGRHFGEVVITKITIFVPANSSTRAEFAFTSTSTLFFLSFSLHAVAMRFAIFYSAINFSRKDLLSCCVKHDARVIAKCCANHLARCAEFRSFIRWKWSKDLKELNLKAQSPVCTSLDIY